MRSYCLFTICEPSDDLSFHLVHRSNRCTRLGERGRTRAQVFVGDIRVTTRVCHERVHRMLNPKRPILVEGGDAFFRRHKLRACLVDGGRLHKCDDRLLGGAVIP
jgi:hypothetical protein